MRGASITHGHTRNISKKMPHSTPEYKTWRSMKTRCNTPGASGYAKSGKVKKDGYTLIFKNSVIVTVEI